MKLQDIINFFDSRAEKWDEINTHNPQVIEKIMDLGGIKDSALVLDIACGTGVLFPHYTERNAIVTGIDISPEMVRIVNKKFKNANVICGDAATYDFGEQFDVIMIYNAYPHFENPKALFANLSKHLKSGGRISVSHGASREEIQKCHSNITEDISLDLPEAHEVAKIMSDFFDVDIVISDSNMYMVSGIKE